MNTTGAVVALDFACTHTRCCVGEVQLHAQPLSRDAPTQGWPAVTRKLRMMSGALPWSHYYYWAETRLHLQISTPHSVFVELRPPPRPPKKVCQHQYEQRKLKIKAPKTKFSKLQSCGKDFFFLMKPTPYSYLHIIGIFTFSSSVPGWKPRTNTFLRSGTHCLCVLREFVVLYITFVTVASESPTTVQSLARLQFSFQRVRACWIQLGPSTFWAWRQRSPLDPGWLWSGWPVVD